MNYPYEIMFPDKDMPGAIRLKVAALCICLDHGSIDGTPIPEPETDAFCQKGKLVSNRETWDGWHRAHAFVNIEPTGNLGRQTGRVITALTDSIKSGELKPLRLRVSLSGDIDPRETWLHFEDFSDWCERRELESNDCLDQYIRDESTIHEAAMNAADSVRAELEILELEDKLKQRTHELDDPSAALDLLKENIALRASKSAPHISEKPLSTRERDTLLTIVAVLCKEAKLDYKTPSKTADLLENMAASMGISISKRGIEGHLKKIPNALRIRTK